MADEKEKSSENIKDQEKILDTKKKILELNEKEKDLRKELQKMSGETLKDQEDYLKNLEKQKKLLDDTIKQRKTLQNDLKESSKKRKDEEDAVSSINDSLKAVIKSQEKLNDLKKKAETGIKPPKPVKAEPQKPLKPLTQEINVKTNTDTSGVTEELSITQKIKGTTDQINDSISEKSASLDTVIGKKQKELLVTQKIADATKASSDIKTAPKEEKPIAKKAEPVKAPKEEKPVAKKAEPVKVPKEEKPVAKKAEPITQEIDVKTNIDNAPLNEALSITQQMNESNREDVKTLLERNQLLNEELKIIQAQQNVSFGYKKQQSEKLLGEIQINKEKLKGLGIDEKALSKKAEPVKAPKEEKPVAKKAEPKPTVAKPTKPESVTQEVNVQTNMDTSALDKGLSLVEAMNQSNNDDLNTLLHKNRVMNDGIKTLLQQQNLSTAYKKQKVEELQNLIKINSEKVKGLGLDEQSLKSVSRNQKKQSKGTGAKESKPTTEGIDPEIPESVAAAYERSLSAARGLSEIAKDIAKKEGYHSDVQKQNIKLLDKAVSLRESIEASIEAAIEEGRDLEDIEKSISKNVQNRIFAQNRLKDLERSCLVDKDKALEKQASIVAAMKSQEEAENRVAQKRKELIDSGETDYEIIEKAIKKEQIKADAAAAEVESLKESLSLHEIEYISLTESVQQYNEVNKALEKQKKHQKDINDRMGLFGKTVRVIGGVLDHYGVGKFLKINEAIEAMRAKAEQNGNRFQVMLTGLGSIGKSLVKSLTDPVVIITSIVALFTTLVKKAIEYNAKIFEAGKNLGMNVAQAGVLKGKFDAIANSNGKLGLTSKELLETQVKMNEQLGFMAPTTDEFAQSTTMIMRRFGASAESMAELQMYATKTGKTLQGTFATVVGTGKAEAAKLKMHMTEKQILEAVSKTSATIQMNFKGSLKEIAAAVVQAQKMGLSLDKINKMGESLLDFESSIQKEMEAQLLTGKEIDLSKARELALVGDTKGLMAEMNKQIGTQAEYEKLNTIQKQAYAEALGMSKDEMDEMYHKQKMANLLGEKANATQGQQYEELMKKQMALGKSKEQAHAEVVKQIGAESAASLQQASVQEKMSAAMERISDIIGKMTQGPLMSLIDRVTNWLSNTQNIENVINKVKHYVDEIAKFFNDKVIPAAKSFWEIAKGVYAAFEPVRSILKDTVKYLLEHKDIAVAIASAYTALQLRKKLINLLGIKGVSSEAKRLPLAKNLTIEENKKLSIIKKQNQELTKQNRLKKGVLKTSQIQNKTEKATTITKRAQTTAERATNTAKKQGLATSLLQGAREKVNAGLSIVRAIAGVVAGSSWMGPLALGVGVAAAAYLYSKLSSAGGGSGSGGGGAGGGEMPKMPTAEDVKKQQDGIKPVNTGAETQKTISTALTTSRQEGDRRGGGPLNLTLVNKTDVITGKNIVKITKEDPSTYGDSSKIVAPN